jgi:hypothetical protein
VRKEKQKERETFGNERSRGRRGRREGKKIYLTPLLHTQIPHSPHCQNNDEGKREKLHDNPPRRM